MNVAPPVSARILVIAAVSDVLPWSTCPIVPMLQCGLSRLNFSFAMVFSILLKQITRRLARGQIGGVFSETMWEWQGLFASAKAREINANDDGCPPSLKLWRDIRLAWRLLTNPH